MNLSTAEIEALEGGAQRIGLFFRLDTPTPLRLWLGIGDIEPGVDAIDDVTGATYSGFGEISQIPEIARLINGEAERVTFELSGVSDAVVAAATVEDAPAVKGCDVAVGFALFDKDWSLLGSIHWMARYTADFLAIEERLTEDPTQPVVRVVQLSVGSAMTGRWRPPYAYYVDQDQQAESSGDLFCERTPQYAEQVTKVWPDF